MNYQRCRQQAIKISGGFFDEKQADDLVRRIADAVKRENATATLDDINSEVHKVLIKEVDNLKMAALYEKKNRIMNTVKKYNALERIQTY